MAVHINYYRPLADGVTYQEGACLSTDTKPVDGFATGSILIEVDTGDVYMFNGTSWQKEMSLQG